MLTSRALLGLAATSVLLVACDDRGDAALDVGAATPSAVAPSETPTAPATVSATEVVVTQSPRPALPLHDEIVDARIGLGENGFIAIDPASGQVNEIWVGTERMWDIDIYPRLAQGGDGVWLSWDNGNIESVRFDLDGAEVDRVPGLWASESSDRRVVLYYTAASGPERHLVARYSDHIADLGEACCGVVADDGRIAFLGAFSDGAQTLRIYEPSTGETWVAADGIRRPGKDGVIYPSWLSGSRYVRDFTSDDANPMVSETIIVDTTTREIHRLPREGATWWVAGADAEPWTARLESGDLVFRRALDGTEVLRLSQPDTEFTGMQDLDGVIAAYTETPEGIAMIAYDLAGREIDRWVGAYWYGTQTSDGLGAIEVGYQDGSWDCPASRIDHPRFEGDVGCVGTGGLWSPDGRYWASRLESPAPPGAVYIFDTSTGTGRIYEVGRPDIGLYWSHDSSRLVVRLGGSM